MFSNNELSKLSIECDEQSVRLVQSRSGNVVSIEHSFVFDWPAGISIQQDPIAAGEWLKRQLVAKAAQDLKAADFNVANLPTTAVVDRESVILKSISLPPVSAGDVVDAADVETLIQYQASTHFSVPVNGLSIGHIMGPPSDVESRCLLMALPQTIVDHWRQFCAAAGLRLESIVSRAVMVTECLRETASLPNDFEKGRIVVVRDASVDSAYAEISFLQASRLIQDIAVMLPADSEDWPKVLAGGIRRLLSGTMTAQPVEVSGVVLVGDFPAEMDDQLSADIELPIGRKNLNALVHQADVSQVRSVGLLASSLVDVLPVNFLDQHHRQNAVQQKTRRLRHGLVAVAAVVVGLFAMNRFSQSQHDQVVTQLVEQRRRIERQVTVGQVDVDLVATIGQWQDVGVSRRLTEFLDEMPPTDQSRLTSLELALRPRTGGLAIKATGVTVRQETVLELNDRLLAHADYRLQPHGIQPVQSNGPMAYRFDLDVAIDGPSGTSTSARKTRSASVESNVPRSESAPGSLNSLRERLARTRVEMVAVRTARQQLIKIAGKTLDATPAVATTQYHKVLLCLAQQYELADPVLTPHRAQPVNDRLSTIPFSLQASTTLEQLQKFVAHFEQLDVLHRLTMIAIEPSHIAGNSNLLCRMQFETACLDVAGVEAKELEYLSPTALFIAPFSERLASVSSRNPFGQPVADAGRPIVAATEVSKPTAVLELVGVIEDGANSEAWFLDKSTGRNHIVKLNGDFDHDALAGRLIAVDEDSATLQVANTQVQLSIGQNARGPQRIAIRP